MLIIKWGVGSREWGVGERTKFEVITCFTNPAQAESLKGLNFDKLWQIVNRSIKIVTVCYILRINFVFIFFYIIEK
ncbi:hypothetical protein WA1_38600 [Scytonema hofmannii PCC 7110]|uniref:Uncharacterized protein n=1 Tax=Scytonema hofmannii PCC 7110 TaxID=128403 RepID=A0A139X0N1_9CYAN|nr:hypothetical protein WA1_38600 [Scytonema hofmannii PCC 7110]